MAALLFVLQQWRSSRPVLDPRVFATSAMAGVGALLTAIQFGYWAVLVYLPLFLSTALLVSIEVAGVALLAATLPMLMKNVGPTRVELATRTIFNLLGPLSNPAGVKRQMVGVFSRHWVQPLAQVLKNLGSDSVWVVHGSDGLDEITLTGPSFVASLDNGKITTFEVTPEDAGLKCCSADALKGGDADANAVALSNVLNGKPSPYRDVALLNAAAALIVAGRAGDLKEGVAIGAKSLDSGAAAARLKHLIAVSRG